VPAEAQGDEGDKNGAAGGNAKPNGKRRTEAMEKMDAGLRRALRVRRHPKQQCFIPDSVLLRLDSSARLYFTSVFFLQQLIYYLGGVLAWNFPIQVNFWLPRALT
jgi:hypothetical protein